MNFTIMGLWSEMGMVARAVVIVLLAMSTYSLAIAVERLLAFRRARISSAAAAALLDTVIVDGARLESAVGVDQKYPHSPLARVAGGAVSEFSKGIGPAAAPGGPASRRGPGGSCRGAEGGGWWTW